MSDHNRRFKKIVRVDDAADARIRAYAAEHSLSTSEAAIKLVMGGAVVVPAPAVPSLALPDDLEERLVKLAQRRKKTLDELKVYALEVAVGRLEAVDRFADAKKGGES